MTGTALPTCAIALADEVATGEQWRQQRPTWLLDSLHDGAITDHDGERTTARYAVEVHALGALPLPDGRLIGCDPYLAEPDLTPFDLDLPPGEFPVAVGIVRIAADHVRPAALVLVTGAGPVTRWTLARTAADDPATGDDLPPGVIVGYGVDAGTGAFLSPLALPALVEVGAEDGGMLEDPLSEAMAASPVDAALLPPRTGALPVAQCASGWGDGVYATWVGWDEYGAIALVMTDFDVAGDPWTSDDDPAATPDAADRDPSAPTSVPTSVPTSPPTTPEPSSGGVWSRLFGRRGR